MSHTKESLQEFLVRETGGRVVIEVLYPIRPAPTPCLRCEDELGQMLEEIFWIWPSDS